MTLSRMKYASHSGPCKAVRRVTHEESSNAQKGGTSRMSACVQVRQACLGDAEVLCNLIHRAYRTNASWTTEAHLVAGQRISSQQLRLQLREAVDPIFVAEHTAATSAELTSGTASQQESPVVGCICAEAARNHPSMGLQDTDALLGLFAVAPEWQSRGVGTRLFQHALQHVQQEWCCQRAVLWVIDSREELLAWYTRLGFAWSGEAKPFVFPDLALVDDMKFKVLTKQL